MLAARPRRSVGVNWRDRGRTRGTFARAGGLDAMTTSRVLYVAFAVATLSACSNDEVPRVDAPSVATPTSPAASPTAGTPTSTPGGTGKLTSGSVTIQLSGDVELERTLETLVNTFYTPPPGGLTIVWTAGDENATTVGLGGSTFTGTRETSQTLSVSVVAQTSDGIARFVSTAGECRITIDIADADEFSGTFRCVDLVATSGEVVDASASFVATR